MTEPGPFDARIVELLEELVLWSRFIARPQLEVGLEKALSDPKRRLTYELTDGERSQTEIAALVGIDQSTVSDMWARWRQAGLVRETGRRPKHLVRLTDLGWNIPSPATEAKRGRSKASTPRVSTNDTSAPPST